MNWSNHLGYSFSLDKKNIGLTLDYALDVNGKKQNPYSAEIDQWSFVGAGIRNL